MRKLYGTLMLLPLLGFLFGVIWAICKVGVLATLFHQAMIVVLTVFCILVGLVLVLILFGFLTRLFFTGLKLLKGQKKG
jgi:hypothetical protein